MMSLPIAMGYVFAYAGWCTVPLLACAVIPPLRVHLQRAYQVSEHLADQLQAHLALGGNVAFNLHVSLALTTAYLCSRATGPCLRALFVLLGGHQAFMLRAKGHRPELRIVFALVYFYNALTVGVPVWLVRTGVQMLLAYALSPVYEAACALSSSVAVPERLLYLGGDDAPVEALCWLLLATSSACALWMRCHCSYFSGYCSKRSKVPYSDTTIATDLAYSWSYNALSISLLIFASTDTSLLVGGPARSRISVPTSCHCLVPATLSFFFAPLPFEAFFFFSHRLLHLPALFSIFHIEHHVPLLPVLLVGGAGTGYAETLLLRGSLMFGLGRTTNDKATLVQLLSAILTDMCDHHYFVQQGEPAHRPYRLLGALLRLGDALIGLGSPGLITTPLALLQLAGMAEPWAAPDVDDDEIGDGHGLHHWERRELWSSGTIEQHLAQFQYIWEGAEKEPAAPADCAATDGRR